MKIVKQLLEFGPKVLLVSLEKELADQFYDAVPDTGKARVSVYPINSKYSLVKWSNTVKEYKIIDPLIGPIQKRRRHRAWAGVHYDNSSSELDAAVNDSLRGSSPDPDETLRIDAQFEESASDPDFRTAGIVENCRGNVLADSKLNVRPSCDTASHDTTPHEDITSLDNCDIGLTLPDPLVLASDNGQLSDDDGSRPSAVPSPALSTSVGRWHRRLFILCLVLLSTASAGLGGLLAWTILAFGPTGMLHSTPAWDILR